MDINNKFIYISVLLCVLGTKDAFAEEMFKNTLDCDSIVENDTLLFSADSFRFDNDMFEFFTNDDRNYTYGLIWNWGNCKARHHIFHTETLQHFIFDSLSVSDSYKDEYTFQFGLTNFTPDNLSSSDVVPDDRPYANLLFINSYLYKVSPGKNYAFGIGTTFGILGSTLGGALQAGWHTVLRETFDSNEPVHPNGWDNQISNGGEITAKIDFSYHRRLAGLPGYMDVVWSVDSSIGYHTTASLGATVKFKGFLRGIDKQVSPYHVTNLSQPASGNTRLVGKPIESFFFVGARYVLVGYNALLECQRKSSFCLDKSQVKPAFTEWSLGAKFPFPSFWDIGHKLDLTISWHGRTAEHKLSKKRNHSWGGITFDWRY